MQDRPAAQTSSDPNSTLAPSAAGSTLRISGRAGSCAVHGARMPNVLSSTQRATEFSPLPVIGGNAKPNTDLAFTQHALPLPASPQASHGEQAICVTELDEKAIHATVEAILRAAQLREQRGIGFTAPGEQAGEDKGMIEQREANEGKKKAEQQTALAIPCEEGKRKAKVKQDAHPPAQITIGGSYDNKVVAQRNPSEFEAHYQGEGEAERQGEFIVPHEDVNDRTKLTGKQLVASFACPDIDIVVKVSGDPRVAGMRAAQSNMFFGVQTRDRRAHALANSLLSKGVAETSTSSPDIAFSKALAHLTSNKQTSEGAERMAQMLERKAVELRNMQATKKAIANLTSIDESIMASIVRAAAAAGYRARRVHEVKAQDPALWRMPARPTSQGSTAETRPCIQLPKGLGILGSALTWAVPNTFHGDGALNTASGAAEMQGGELRIPLPRPCTNGSTDGSITRMQQAALSAEAPLPSRYPSAPPTGNWAVGMDHMDVDAKRSMVLMENMTLEHGAHDMSFSPSRQPYSSFLGYFESIDASALLRDFPMDGDMAGIDFLGGGITPRDLNDTGSPLGDGLRIGGDLLVASDQRTVHLEPNNHVPNEAHPNIGLPNKAAELNKDLLLSKQDQDISPSTTSVKPLDPAKTHSKDSPPCPPAIQNSSLGQQHRCPHLVPLVQPSPGKSASCQLPITLQPLLAPAVAIPYSCSPHVSRVSWAANAHSNSPHMSRANLALTSPEAPLRVGIPADGALIARRRAAQTDKGLFARLSNSFTLPNSELQPVAGQHLLNSTSPLGQPQSPTQHFNQARASQAIPEPQQKVQQQYRQYQLHLTQEADALAPEPNIQDGAGDCPSHVPLSLAHIPERDLMQMDALWGHMHVAATQGNKHMTDKQPGPTQIEQTSAQAATSLGVMQMPDTTQFFGTAKRDRGASITNYDVDRKAREGSQPASAAQATLDAYVVLPEVMSIQPESPAWMMGCGLPTAFTKACEAEKSTPTGPDLMMAEACLQDLLNDLAPVYEVGLDKPLNNESTELQRPAMLASEHMITDTSLPGAQPVTVPGILRGKACSLENISCSLHGNKGSGCGSLPTTLDALSSFDFLPRDMSSIVGGLGSLSGGLSKLPSGLNSTPSELGRMLGDLGRIPGGLGLMLDGLGGPHGLLGSRGSLPPSSEDGLGSMFNNHSGLLGSLDSIPSGFSSVPRGSLNPNPRIFNTSSLGLTFSSPALQHNLPSGLPPTLICPQYSPPCLSGPHLDGLAGTWPGLSAWAGVPEMLKPPRLSQVPGSLMLAEPGGLANATASSTPGTMMTSSSRRRVTSLRSDSAGATPGYRHEALQSPVVGSAMESDDDLCGGLSHSEEGLTEAAMTLRPHNSHGGKERKLTKVMMQEVYHLPINEAAEQLGVGVTVLKKFCRSFKVERWPYRKLKSIDKLINSVEAQRAEFPVDTTYVLEQLQATKSMVYDDPEHALDERILKLRQANFKLEYKKRQTSSTPVPEAYGLGNTTSLHAEHAIPALAIMLDADAVAVISRAEAAI